MLEASRKSATGTPLSLRERAKRDKIRRIRQATEELLTTRSLSEITMRDVAELAEIGEATLFRYVAAKEELLLLVFGQRTEELVSSVEGDPRFQPRPGMTGPEVLESVYRLYDQRAELYLSDPPNVTDYVRVGFAIDTPLGAMSMDNGDRFIAVVEALLAAGQQEGVLDSRWDPHVIAGNCHGLFIHEILRSPARGYTPETFIQRVRERLSVQLEPTLTT
jgi:AcrR family transcriptional regulator